MRKHAWLLTLTFKRMLSCIERIDSQGVLADLLKIIENGMRTFHGDRGSF